MVTINAGARAVCNHRAGQKIGRASNSTQAIVTRYRSALSDVPAPGSGQSHRWLLSVANYARLAGVPADETVRDLHAAIPRKSGRDIRCAVQRAYDAPCGDFSPERYVTPPRRKKTVSGAFWREILERHPEPMAELWERSPIRLGNPDDDVYVALEALYAPDDLLFIGGAKECGVPGGNIRSCREWLAYRGRWPEHTIVNPLSGALAETKTGGLSYRCDNAVARHLYCVVEFDNRAIDEQAAFWCDAIGRGVPVAALVHSGRRSLHAWISCAADDVAGLFERLEPFGVDMMTRNPSRMSRTPGAHRDGGSRQSLLYLAPEVAA